MPGHFRQPPHRRTNVGHLPKIPPEHHRFQGVDGIDMDIPTLTEAHLVTNILANPYGSSCNSSSTPSGLFS
ncbi:hypothetical protein C3L33_06241, partial [Rhododendron williamsianum]